MPISKVGSLPYNRRVLLAYYKKRFRLENDIKFLAGFFNKRKVVAGLSKKDVLLCIEIYKTTDFVFQEDDIKA